MTVPSPGPILTARPQVSSVVQGPDDSAAITRDRFSGRVEPNRRATARRVDAECGHSHAHPVGQLLSCPTGYAVAQTAARNLRSRRLFATTNTEENAIAAPAIIGLSSPAAASGSAATL